jgi:hypothetical protein
MPVFLDEIQYAPQLLSHLQMRIDQDASHCGHWLLTGSQQFGLMRDVSAARTAMARLSAMATRTPCPVS